MVGGKGPEAGKYSEMVARMEQAWLVRLLEEFDAICAESGISLRAPIFEISDSRRMLGSWLSDTRVIRISGFLILTYPWWMTRQVLRHEVAHQLCSEFFHTTEAGHGQVFQKACELIGVPEAFRSSTADTEQELRLLAQGKNGGESDRILDKVKKLMALGQSGNEHEAAAALRKAERLLRRYNLSPGNKGEKRPFIRRTIDTGMQRMAVHIRVLATLLETFFSVRVVLATQYDPRCDRVHKTIELLGSQENTACAEYCFHFISDRLEYLWDYHKHSITGNRRTARKSFYLGILSGFRETLERERKRPGAYVSPEEAREVNDALVATGGRLDRFTAQHFPRLSRRRGRRITLNPEAYDRAHLEGKKIRLHQPVDSAGTGKTRLIG